AGGCGRARRRRARGRPCPSAGRPGPRVAPWPATQAPRRGRFNFNSLIPRGPRVQTRGVMRGRFLPAVLAAAALGLAGVGATTLGLAAFAPSIAAAQPAKQGAKAKAAPAK